MEAVRIRQVVLKDGEVSVKGMPYKKGETVEIIVFPQAPSATARSRLTVGQLRKSGLIGMWKDRAEIQDSAVFARRLREKSQNRGDIDYDPVG